MSIDPNKIVAKLISIAKESTDSYRAKLDKNVHVVDISYGALKLSDPKLQQADYVLILSALQDEFKTIGSLKDAISRIKDPDLARGTAYLSDDSYGTYLLAKNYQALQGRVAKVLKSTNIGSEFTGTDDNGKTTTNIGHIPNNYVDAGVSPLSAKITNIIARLPVASATPLIKELVALEDTHVFETSYEFQRENFDLKGFNKLLGKGVVLVTLHSASLNNKFAIIEKKINDTVIKYLNSIEFTNDLINTPGSNTILEDFTDAIRVAFGGKSNGKGKHNAKPPVKGKKTEKDKTQVTGYKLPAIRTTKGKFYSLASLQILLNGLLMERIYKNMGKGDSRTVLNFRTGRFAASAHVERLTQSKEGMITAFYTYMKNPYQVFEPGHRQGSPTSRDPKLLISKSIREIAATQVANRMRAVLV